MRNTMDRMHRQNRKCLPLLRSAGVLAVLLLLASAEGCDFPLPRFTEPVANVTVVRGRDATLKCSVSSLKCSGEHTNNFKVAWVKADTQTLLSIEETMISRNYRLRVTHSDANTWFLHIGKTQLADRGYYMCQVNTIPMLFNKGYLEVIVPPNIVDGETSGDVEVGEDSPSSLHCHATGYPAPTVRFKREDGILIRRGGANGASVVSETVSQGGTMLTKTTLSYVSTGRSDMGHYLCIANNSVPPSVSKRITLNVRSGRYTVTESVVGDTPPVVVSTIRIAGVQAGDVSAYTCSATINNDSSRSKSLTVQLNDIFLHPNMRQGNLDQPQHSHGAGVNDRSEASGAAAITAHLATFLLFAVQNLVKMTIIMKE
ncbi:hemicentin-2-like [Hyalella azteca]|uniref:Hemicentin-2-like n=1 Tax=Hyalella azteca TaxID=294128 RepID=A0A979FK58_HYAAZ|nr:hemicentin-2-like [Hyalella azteca]